MLPKVGTTHPPSLNAVPQSSITMGFQLEKVVPWGRSLDEYIGMFDLTLDNQTLKTLDCAGGPASFNAQMTERGYSVTSCDPIYQFTAEEIASRIEETRPLISQGVRDNSDNYVWQTIQSVDRLIKIRMEAMQEFLQDFSVGVKQTRYICAKLPNLPFNNSAFDLGLCSHFLFAYSDHFSEKFHRESVRELCRVAKEVRIFPLLKISGELSPWLSPVIQELEMKGYQVGIKRVHYEFQKGGNKMLWIRRS